MAAPWRATDLTGISDPSIVRFRALVEAGLAALESRREEVNDLNVFPVADGDTGDNMVLTLRAVLTELDRLAGASEGRTIDEIGRDEIVASVQRVSDIIGRISQAAAEQSAGIGTVSDTIAQLDHATQQNAALVEQSAAAAAS